MTTGSILIVDDDRELCKMLGEYLADQSFGVVESYHGLEAAGRIEREAFDLIILDVMLPGLNGFEVLKRVRLTSATPVIMLTARGEDADCILGLELGADDYLAKPFNPRQLTARIRAVLRRTREPDEPARRALVVGPLYLDPTTLKATLSGVPLDLTGTEYRLLETLMSSPGQMLRRDELSERVLGRPLTAYDRSIDTHVSNLRRKLVSSGGDEIEVLNFRGVGYSLVARGGASA